MNHPGTTQQVVRLNTKTKAFLSVAAMTAVLLLYISAAYGRTSVEVKPTNPNPNIPESLNYFVHELRPGETLVDSISITNLENVSVTLKVYSADAFTLVNSGIGFKGEGERAMTGGWITSTTNVITLETGLQAIIPFTITVPTNTVPGEYYGGIVTQDSGTWETRQAYTRTEDSDNVEKEASQFNLKVVQRVAVMSQINVPGYLYRILKIDDMQAIVSNGKMTFVADINNRGNTRLKPNGHFVITNTEGLRISNSPIQMNNVLPGDKIPYTFSLTDTLPEGIFQGLLELRYGITGTVSYGPWEFKVSNEEAEEMEEVARLEAEAKPQSIIVVRKSFEDEVLLWRTGVASVIIAFLAYWGIKKKAYSRIRNRFKNRS